MLDHVARVRLPAGIDRINPKRRPHRSEILHLHVREEGGAVPEDAVVVQAGTPEGGQHLGPDLVVAALVLDRVGTRPQPDDEGDSLHLARSYINVRWVLDPRR